MRHIESPEPGSPRIAADEIFPYAALPPVIADAGENLGAMAIQVTFMP